MKKEITELIEKIHEGISNLKNRTNFNILRIRDRLCEVELAVNDYRKRENSDAINHMITIFTETNTSCPEGSSAFNDSIWNADVEVSGKQTTLEKLFLDLDELVKSSYDEKI